MIEGHLLPGNRFQPRASDWNTLVDVGREFQSQLLDQRIVQEKFGRDATIGLVRNNSGANVPAFGVLSIRAPIITPTNNLAEFRGLRPNVEGYEPSEAEGDLVSPTRFGIVTEPLEDGAVGSICVAGVVPCQVYMVAESHRFADPTDGVTAYLESNGTGGGAQILWAEPGLGLKWALVRLGYCCSDCTCCMTAVEDTATTTGTISSSMSWQLPYSVVWHFRLHVLAQEVDGSATASYWRYGQIREPGNGNVPTIDLGTTAGIDSGSNNGLPPPHWSLTLDTTLVPGLVVLTVQGGENETVKWTACLEYLELPITPTEIERSVDVPSATGTNQVYKSAAGALELEDGDTLIYLVAGTNSNPGSDGAAVTWGILDFSESTTALTEIAGHVRVLSGGEDLVARVFMYQHSGGTESRGVEVNFDAAISAWIVRGIVVKGLTGNNQHVASADGNSDTPDSGNTASATAPVYLQGLFVTAGSTADDDGELAENCAIHGTDTEETDAATDIKLCEAYDFKSADGPWKARKLGITSGEWIAIAVAFE